VWAGFGSVFFTQEFPAGGVSMVSQSGGFGFSVLALSSLDGGLAFRQMVTTGNEIGVSTLDFVDYFIRDPHTDVIVGYIEGVKDAHRLHGIGMKAMEAGKPILMWKVGNTDEGQKAAASHTANLGGAMALYTAAFKQTGIIQIDDIQDMVDYGRMFRCGKLPGRRSKSAAVASAIRCNPKRRRRKRSNCATRASAIRNGFSPTDLVTASTD